MDRTGTAHLIRRWAFVVLAFDFLALAILGTWLAFRYEPGASSASGAHAVLGAIAVIAAVIAAAATVADSTRSTPTILPAIVVLAVIAGLYLTGATLGWDRLAVNGPTGPQRGIAVVFDENVGAVAQGNRVMTVQTYRRYAWLHTVALPVAVVAMAGAGLWGVRRRRRYVGQHTIDLTTAASDG
ncbi:MAG: hypothetical protein JWO68_1676 [Actinomycetia bacterium]|nr:hypothetical protein [Actinomycetes bacterium]